MSTKSLAEVLSTYLTFWGDLTKEERKDVLVNAVTRSYKAGAYIPHSTSKQCPGVQIVTHGTVRVFMSSNDGKQLTLLRTADRQVFVIGQSCVLDRPVYDVGLETETKCEIVLIPRSICKELCESNAGVRKVFLDEIASDFSKIFSVLEFVTFSGMKQRLANALIERSQLAGTLLFRATHAGIGADIGSMRETVSRSLHDFQRRGWITVNRGEIKITDMQALIALRGKYHGSINELLYPRATQKEQHSY